MVQRAPDPTVPQVVRESDTSGLLAIIFILFCKVGVWGGVPPNLLFYFSERPERPEQEVREVQRMILGYMYIFWDFWIVYYLFFIFSDLAKTARSGRSEIT